MSFLKNRLITERNAMEQAEQFAVNVNKIIEAHNNGNNEDVHTYLLANGCVDSYKKHRDYVYYLTQNDTDAYIP
jgi:hypothetical protein